MNMCQYFLFFAEQATHACKISELRTSLGTRADCKSEMFITLELLYYYFTTLTCVELIYDSHSFT